MEMLREILIRKSLFESCMNLLVTASLLINIGNEYIIGQNFTVPTNGLHVL